MRIFAKGALTGLALVFAVSTSATAQIDRTYDATNAILLAAGSVVVAPPSCTAGYDLNSFNFQECSGAWSGNDSGEAVPAESQVVDYINAVWGLSSPGAEFDFGNTSLVLSGEFVVAVKGSNEFSLFYFANHDGTALDWQQAMLGVSVNRQGRARGVSHVTVYGGTVEVPEPGTMLLITTGVLGMAMLRRREDEDA